MNGIKVPLLRLQYSDEEVEMICSDIASVLRSGQLTMGDRVRELERVFADFCGARLALGTNSGTSALEMALRAIDVANATVVMPSNTYMATPLAAIKAGARVVFCECERESMQVDPRDLERKIQPDTKAVVLIHIGGLITGHLERIIAHCRERSIPLIEDAAHAHGAEYGGTRAGTFGLAGTFSFYPTKVLTTGEGGMLVTSCDDVYAKAVVLREHGKVDHRFNVHTEIGDNWRYSEIHAVLGLHQMRKAETLLGERRRLADLYDRMLLDVPEIRPVRPAPHVRSSYYKYMAFLPEDIDREVFRQNMLSGHGVELPGEVYSHPCHSQPVFRKYPDRIANRYDDEFPETDYVCRHHICLPLYPGLRDEEAAYVVEALRSCLDRY